MESPLTRQLAALAHDDRLALFRLLSRRAPQAVPAGEIARSLGLKPSTASAHLSTLTEAGLLTRRRVGTSLLYELDRTAVQQLTGALLLDCCRGRPDLCPPLPMPDETLPVAARPLNVLFLCSGNSCRSIFAEAILRRLGGGRFAAHSAGTRPYSTLNSFAIELLRQKGHDIAPLRAKHVSEFQGPDAPVMDFVFTVCDAAAGETCPPWPGQPITAHWSMPDPVRVEGTEAEKRLAFQQAYGLILNRLQAFVALPFDSLTRLAAQARVDAIASEETDR